MEKRESGNYEIMSDENSFSDKKIDVNIEIRQELNNEQREIKEINMEEYEERFDNNNGNNEDNFKKTAVFNYNRKHIYNYKGKYIETNSDYITENLDSSSKKEIEIYDSHQDISFEKNFSHDNSNINSPINKFVIENEKDLSDIKENKTMNSLNTRQKNQIKKTNTIGEVSNENASSFSYKKDDSSFLNQMTSDEGIYDSIDRASKNLATLDFIIIANKSMNHIHHINYSYNKIKTMDDSLFYLGYIITIDLSHNEIFKIQNLDNCLNLKYLNLSHNNIQILEGLYHLQQLEVLDISFNKISMCDIIIKKLKFNKSLKSVNLEGNLNYNFEDLKYKLLEHIDSVCILDNKEIYRIRNKPTTNSTGYFKLFFTSGDKNNLGQRPHNLKTIKDYIRFKRYFYQEEKKLKSKLK